MNIVNPQDTGHTLRIIPRYYPLGDVSVVLYNEEKKQETSITITPVVVNGYMFLSFEKTFLNNENYRLTVTEGNEIVYRGKIFATTQAEDTQDYKISNDVFII